MSEFPLSNLFFEQVKSNMRSNRADDRAEERAGQSEIYRIEDAKRRMLSDPAQIEKAVANITDYLSPTASTKKAKGESYGVDTVEASKDSNDPTLGYGNRLRETFTNRLMDSRLAGVPVGEILHRTSKELMEIPQADGKSLTEKSHEFARIEGSRWFGGVPHKKLPGYDAWKADRQIQEKQQSDRESWLPSIEEFATDTGAGAAFGFAAGQWGGGGKGAAAGATLGAALGAMTGPAAPIAVPLGTVIGGIGGFFAGKATGGLVGAGMGAAVGAGGSLVAAPLKKLLHKTEWYQGMVSSNSVADKAKAILMDVATYIPGSLATGAGLDKGITKYMKGVGSGLEELGTLGGEGANVTGVRYAADGTPILSPMLEGSASRIDNELPAIVSAVKETSTVSSFTPFVEPSSDIDKLLGTAGKSQAWGRQAKPLLPEAVDSTKEVVSLLKEGVTEYKIGLPKIESEELLLPTVGVKEGSSIMTPRKPGSYDRMSALDRLIADARAANEIDASVQSTAKAKSSIAAKPTASNIVETIKNTTTEVKPVVGSDIVEKSQSLSSKALQETGLEPVIDPDVTPLSGSLPEKINKAHERDSFVKIGAEDADGPTRSLIAENSANEFKAKKTVFTPDEPVVEALTTPKSDVIPTVAEKEATIKNVNKFTEGTDSVVEEFFPETKKLALPEIKNKYYQSLGVKDDAERLAQMREEAFANVKADRANEGSKVPITDAEIEKEFKLIKKEETENFRFWADDNKIELPNEMNKKNYKLIAGMMAFGVSAPVLYASLSDDPKNEVNASMLSSLTSFAKASAGTIAKKGSLVEDSLKAGLIAKSVEKGQKVMGAENFQHGIVMNPDEVVNIVNGNLRAGKGTGAQYALMSPFQTLEALFTTGKGKLVNAATHLASFVTAGSRTRENALRVVGNVLTDAGIEAVPNQVKEATKHLVPLGAKATKADIAVLKLRQAEDRVAGYMEKLSKNVKEEEALEINSTIRVEQEGIAKLKETLGELSGATKTYHDEWTKTMTDLSGKHASVRVSLALEDPTRALYPWLPQLSRNEEVAVGQLRGLMDQYKVRLKERGIPVRDNFFPHSPHPEMSKLYQAELEDILGGVPFQKFYSRTDSSRALLPDINYSMNHYLTDIEPRIQNYDFWIKSGWEKVRHLDAVKFNPGVKRAFDQLWEGSKPQEQSWGNTAARVYSEFEAVQKLFLSPSAGLKHLVKMTADIASVGPSVFLKSLPETVGYLGRTALNKTWGMNQNSLKQALGKMGIKSERFNRQLIDDYMDSAIMSGNMRKYMMDMGIESQDQIFNTARNLWNKTQDVGALWINMAELADRATSVSSALQMAAKRGMTVDQAMYGTYDLILKNNFLFGQFNPSWLNNPKIRAFLMFQATPHKIFERRLVNAQRSYANIGQLSSEIQKVVKQPGGWDKVWQASKEMKQYMREGQSELKSNLIIDTLRQEQDFFGTPIIRQMVMDMLTVGAATYGGAQAGLALSDHFFHIPFISTMSEPGKPQLAISPLASGVMEGYAAWKAREPNEDFQFKNVMDRWLGKHGPLPVTLQKAIRLSNNDVPEIYRKGGGNEFMKYFFGLPGKE